MASYVLSREADRDIEDIAENSTARWGAARAKAYILELHATFERLAAFPSLGRSTSHLRAGYRRMEATRQVVFYQIIEDDILVVRVLHQSMLPDLHL